MADLPVPDIENDVTANVPRVLGVRSDDSLALAPNVEALPLAGGTLTGDLTMAGNVGFKISSSKTPGYGVGELKAGNGASLRIYSESDANLANRIVVNGSLFDMAAGCKLLVRGEAEVKGDLYVAGTIYGTLAFGIADGIDTAEVLKRAETATMPVVDDEAVPTTGAEVESITVNEVVTALLAKVKELSARVSQLEKDIKQ